VFKLETLAEDEQEHLDRRGVSAALGINFSEPAILGVS